tara:strand:+ start:2927 stop:3376 length:450 start_codon:yes stop_codon:yes gene_type:complete
VGFFISTGGKMLQTRFTSDQYQHRINGALKSVIQSSAFQLDLFVQWLNAGLAIGVCDKVLGITQQDRDNKLHDFWLPTIWIGDYGEGDVIIGGLGWSARQAHAFGDALCGILLEGGHELEYSITAYSNSPCYEVTICRYSILKGFASQT